MARTGKWPARVSLALSIAMIAALFSVISASGQQATTAGILTVGVDVQSASITQGTYTIVVANQGTAPTTGVRVRANVPNSMTFESSDPAPVTTTSPGSGATSCANGGAREPAGTTCEWSLGTLNPGETRTITAIYNLPQTNTATERFKLTATATDNEQHSNADTDESLTRQKVTPDQDTWVDDTEPPNTTHGNCAYLRVLQGNRVTSYLDIASSGFATPPAGSSGETSTTTSIEALYGAQLRLEVLDTNYSQQTPGVIGAHRVTSPNWTEGSGGCEGQGATSSTTTDARTGGEPTSAPAPTGTTEVGAAAQVVNFDVTPDLDTEPERGSFNGWELRDEATTGTDAQTRFHSSESTTGQVPQIFLVYVTAESATCIDGDPDDAARAVGTEHLMTAYVTDGNKTPSGGTAPGSGTGPGGDACNGAPVATSVEWVIEDDTPDIYFSSQEGQPIQKVVSGSPSNAGPNTIVTTADNNGLTGAGVRLDVTPGADNSNRIEVRIQGATGDPDPPSTGTPDPTQGTCSPTPVPQNKNCSGESAQFDDMTVTWAQQSSGASSASASSASASSSTSASASSSSSASASASSSSSASASASRSASTTGGTTSGSTTSQGQSSRTVTLFASTNEVVYPGQVTLSGNITSADSSCDDAGEFVQIQRRLLGESQYSDFEAQNTDANGHFEISFAATESAEYIAVAPRHDQCADATSTSESVLVKVKVTAAAGRRSVKRGASVGIVGRVQPDHDGTRVVLQRKKGTRFVKVDQARLNSRSRYRFVMKASWRGKRVFRVVWKQQDENHESNNSKNVIIRATRG